MKKEKIQDLLDEVGKLYADCYGNVKLNEHTVMDLLDALHDLRHAQTVIEHMVHRVGTREMNERFTVAEINRAIGDE